MLVTVDDVNFCDGLECVYVKYKSRASTSRELPDKDMGFCRLNMAVILRHGFLCNISGLHIFW